MPVTPYQTNLFQDHQQLYQLLDRGKQQSIEKDCTQIISISQEIPLLDPLAVLQAIAQPNRLQFYLEKRITNQAIAAIDAAICLKIEGSDRFAKAKRFMQTCLTNTISKGNLDLPFAGPHFFCSFTFFEEQQGLDSPFPAATIFLPRWQVSLHKSHCVVVANIEINSQVNLDLLVESLGSQLRTISGSGRRISAIKQKAENQLIEEVAKNTEQFKLSVVSALKSIQGNQFSKIVLANALDVVSPQPFNLVSSLEKLRSRHLDCYIFSTSNGKGETFIGASPERLISIRNQQLETDALAGSAPRGKTPAEDAEEADRLLSSEKERREHWFVRDFIVERLSGLGLIPEMRATPQLRQLSNIQHLWTPIQAQLLSNIHPLEIIAKLHPTPAVSGFPIQIAQEQIRRYETFDRSLYAAPLGWIDYQGNCEFIVGIRSALIESTPACSTSPNTYRARLYSGAGIVAGSDPNKELAEIQLKFQALLKGLL